MPDYDLQAFDMYAGFLPINNKKHIYYMFVESQYDKERDPIIIYLNGGPGCSALHSWGMSTGPYIMKEGEERFSEGLNPYSWNVNANVLYLDSVVGVGYSYSEDGYNPKPNWNDLTMTGDALEAIKVWLARFPEFKDHEIFLAGESYAGLQ
jgi:carboxypeptidase C (cathepsin A)